MGKGAGEGGVRRRREVGRGLVGVFDVDGGEVEKKGYSLLAHNCQRLLGANL